MKTTLPAIAIIGASILLGGCITPNVSDMTAQQFKDKFTFVSRDDFKKITTVKSEEVRFTRISGVSRETYQLVATKKDGDNIFYRLKLHTDHKGRVFWKSAVDQNGNEFSLETNDVSVSDLSVEEWCSAQLSREYLESIRKTGIYWRFYGSTETTAPMSPQAIDGFLMRVDEVFKE